MYKRTVKALFQRPPSNRISAWLGRSGAPSQSEREAEILCNVRYSDQLVVGTEYVHVSGARRRIAPSLKCGSRRNPAQSPNTISG